MRMHLTLFLVLLNSFFLEEARGAETIIGCGQGGTVNAARPEEFCQPYAKLLQAFPGDREVSVRNTLCKAHFTNSLNTIREVCALAKTRTDPTARKAELDAIQKKLAVSIGAKFAGQVQETRMAWEAQNLAVRDSEDLYEKLHAKSKAFRTSHGTYLENQHAFLQSTGSKRLLAESGGAPGQCGVPDANNVLQVSTAYLLHSADALKFGILMRGLFELKLKEVASVAAEAEGKADELKANGVRLGDSSAWTVPKPPKQTEASLLFAKEVKSFQGAATTGAKHALMEAAVILALEEVAAVEQMLKKLLGPHAHHASHVGGVVLGVGLIALDIKLRQSKVGGMDNLDYTMAGAQILGVGLYAAGFFPPAWPGIVTAGLYASALYLFENGLRNLASLIPEARKRVYFDWLKNASKHQQFKSSQQASADFACDYISGLSSNIGSFGHVWPSETMLFTFRNHYKEIEYKQFSDCCLKLVKAPK